MRLLKGNMSVPGCKQEGVSMTSGERERERKEENEAPLSSSPEILSFLLPSLVFFNFLFWQYCCPLVLQVSVAVLYKVPILLSLLTDGTCLPPPLSAVEIDVLSRGIRLLNTLG